MHQIWDAVHNKHLLHNASYVNGQYIGSNEVKHIINPSTEEEVMSVRRLGINMLKSVIDSAEVAFHKWRKVNNHERAKRLRIWHDLIIKNIDDLSYILTVEQGKPLHESRTEIMYAASFIEWFAEEAKRLYGTEIPAKDNQQEIFSIKQPVGVCVAITPWNFPAAMVTRKVAPALAAGCSIILKPSELTPLTALALVSLAEDAGIPQGCFNVIIGKSAEMIDLLLEDSRIRKLSFTGSTEVGRMLAAKCSHNLKRLSLELGGHAPLIVFEDADINHAVEGVIISNYRNSGQSCISPNRIIVHESIHDRFIERLSEKIKTTMIINDGLNIKTTHGPLINREAVNKVDHLVKDALAKGAKLHLGGHAIDRVGYFYAPTILSNVTYEMELATKEIFGPVSPVYKFKTDAEALELANKSEYGLASYFYTKNVNRIWSFSADLEYGMVGINETKISSEIAPFGGVKQSGYGREGSYLGIEEYIQYKYLCWSY